MASPLQNRIVGTIIVIALAVIILPDLLSGKNVQREENLQVSPLRPQLDTQFEEAEFPEDFQERSQRDSTPLDITPVDASAESQQTDDSASRTEAAEAADVEVESLPQEPVTAGSTDSQSEQTTEATSANAWVIQLGAFRNQQSVAELVNELKAEGFSAYSRRAQGANGELHLLLVGPDLDRETLENQLPELKEITRLDGRIIRYQPAQ